MKKFMLIATILAFVTSCSPESLTNDDQQIDKKQYEVPPNG
ncbi:hypothetical protein ACFQO1_02280 [Jejudonia soesokkakensis]|uniref:Lipoprotein n=1 Tax=Jejudonia soesokkakensis TaxID=1323432 RepID=A0ABW2MQ41_9FLAO